LLFDSGDFFLELIGAEIVHLPQSTDLIQREAGLAQAIFGGLAVVLCNILIGAGYLFKQLKQYHSGVFSQLVRQEVPRLRHRPREQLPLLWAECQPESFPELGRSRARWPFQDRFPCPTA
jgi:hypothetical protein